MSLVWQCPWYATVFRADQFEDALREIAPVALRYGATEYAVYRQVDDRYRFTQFATFENKQQYETYWHGREFTEWRADYSSFFQVPVVYTSATLVTAGTLEPNGVRGAFPG
jgi:quinol monooxygenase YgiN